MLAQYLPILIFLCVSTVIGVVLIILGGLLGPTRPDSEKLSPYECGFEAFEDTMTRKLIRELDGLVLSDLDPGSVDIADLIRPIPLDPAQ